MSDNTQLNVGSGGNTVRDIDKNGVRTQVVAIDIGGAGDESLLTSALPVSNENSNDILVNILDQLRLITAHLESLSDQHITKMDL